MSSDLWSFSLATYARPGVEDACLQLQTAGANVCLMLCGLWLEQRAETSDQQRVRMLQAQTEPWEFEVVQPIQHSVIQRQLRFARLGKESKPTVTIGRVHSCQSEMVC
mgnify:CR=1 FL=1